MCLCVWVYDVSIARRLAHDGSVFRFSVMELFFQHQ